MNSGMIHSWPITNGICRLMKEFSFKLEYVFIKINSLKQIEQIFRTCHLYQTPQEPINLQQFPVILVLLIVACKCCFTVIPYLKKNSSACWIVYLHEAVSVFAKVKIFFNLKFAWKGRNSLKRIVNIKCYWIKLVFF